MKKYIVDEERLLKLLNRDNVLDALEAGGVNNWEWYGDSLDDNYEETTEIPENFEEYKGE